MTKFEDLQHQAVTLLQAAAADNTSALYQVPVIEHLGSSANQTAITDAQQNLGSVVIVTIPRVARLVSQAPGTNGTPLAVLDAAFGVEIDLNIERNDPTHNVPNPPALGGLNKNMFQLVEAVVRTLLTFKTNNPNDVFKLGQEALMGDHFDAGIWAYDLMFIKRCAL